MDRGKRAPARFGVRQMAIAGILTAMTVVTTVFTKIPFPIILGYFNLGDAVVLIAGALFGGLTGAFAGAVGSAAADLLTGGYLFAPISLIVKGAEGLITGLLSDGWRRAGRRGRGLTPALIVGAAVMAAGDFIAEAAVLSFVDRAFGLGAAVAELPFNLVQGGLSVALARVAVEGLKRSGILR